MKNAYESLAQEAKDEGIHDDEFVAKLLDELKAASGPLRLTSTTAAALVVAALVFAGIGFYFGSQRFADQLQNQDRLARIKITSLEDQVEDLKARLVVEQGKAGENRAEYQDRSTSLEAAYAQLQEQYDHLAQNNVQLTERILELVSLSSGPAETPAVGDEADPAETP